MALYCANCFRQLHDPGGDLSGKVCPYCRADSSNLRRVERQKFPVENVGGRTVGAAVIGAVVASVIFGPEAAILGGIVGGLIAKANEKKP